jgi:hypothetical protein
MRNGILSGRPTRHRSMAFCFLVSGHDAPSQRRQRLSPPRAAVSTAGCAKIEIIDRPGGPVIGVTLAWR